MAESGLKTAREKGTDEPAQTKASLQRELDKTRESLADTIGDIKETVTERYDSIKETVGGVMNFREQFQNEPLMWSLGALSAGFALGYTTGYAHKEMRAKSKQSEISAFTNSLVGEISTVGKTLVMPTLNLRIRELFGFDFSDLLAQMDQAGGTPRKARARKRTTTKQVKGSTKKTPKTKPNGK